MKNLLLASAAAAALSACLSAAPALALSNGSFETGDFSSWTVVGDAAVVTAGTYGDNGYSVTPTDGRYMALMTTGAVDLGTLGAALGNDLATAYPDGYSGSAIYQDVTVTAGTQLTFDWNFIANDYMPYNDTAILTAFVIDINANQIISLSDVSSVGDYGTTGWQTWSEAANISGTYRIGFAVFNQGDDILNSQLFVDNVQFGAVPEPSTWAMLLVGFAGLGYAGSRSTRPAQALAA